MTLTATKLLNLSRRYAVGVVGGLVLAACSDAADAPQGSAPQPLSQTSTVVPVAAKSNALSAIDMGEKVFKKCRTCHTVDEGGRHKVGPNLWAIYGSTAGSKEGFAYSKAMKESGIVWNTETMSGYVENPSEYMPGNRMSFVGLRKAEDRENLDAYLRSVTTPTGE